MAVPVGLSNILTKTAPDKITVAVEQILDILNKINKVVSEINSIDFCNPLGYILTKALPPGGILEGKLLKYGKSISDFINKIENKMSPDILPNETEEQYQTRIRSYQTQIESIRVTLNEILPPPELADIIPGGEGLIKTINALNLALVAGSDVAGMQADPSTIKTKISLLKSFIKKLAPFTNPINIATLAIGNKAEELNKMLSGFIKPERFKEGLTVIIKLVKSVDKAITQIQKIVKLLNNIIKLLNTLLKIYAFILKLLKILPAPATFVPIGAIVTVSARAALMQQQIDELKKLFSMISYFLDKSILLQINKIRKQILKLLKGLNILYKNLAACQYTNDPQTLQSIQLSIDSLNNNLNLIDDLFPTAVDLLSDSLTNNLNVDSTTTSNVNSTTTLNISPTNNLNNLNNLSPTTSKTSTIKITPPKIYNGYQISIIKEEVVDKGISILRRRVIVSDQRGIIQYEGKPTYANKDYILISEGQYYVDKQLQRSTSDKSNDISSNQDIIDIVKEMGLDPTNTIIGTVEPD